MRTIFFCLVVFAIGLVLASGAMAQADNICTEAGYTPSLDSPFAHVPYVFGHISVRGSDPNSKLPKVVVKLDEGQGAAERQILGKSGNYCFKRRAGGGTLIVEVDGIEATRRTLPSMGGSQQREDFEVLGPNSQASAPPGVISGKFVHPPNDKTADLYRAAAEAEQKKDKGRVIELLKQIVAADAQDFVAFAKLGAYYLEDNKFSESDAAFRKSLELRQDYTPAWVQVGQLRIAQKQFPAAIEILKYAVTLDPANAMTYRVLGEAYLQAKQGTLGVQALDEALRLDPVGMAECHLVKGHLYELANAKQLAAAEYRSFLKKVPEHPDKKRLEKFIKDNP